MENLFINREQHLDLFCNVAYTSLKAVTTDSWYFDSGCSRHMTGNRKYLTDYHVVAESHVSFGDGEKWRVLGKGTLNANGLLRLKNVLHVEGLKVNLMSISQLCDQKLNVKFTKNSCKMLNKSREVVLKGSRSFDNCYQLIKSHTCHKVSHDNIDLWHQKLSHLNFKNLTKIVNTYVVRGIPTLSKKEPGVCGPYQFGKQLMESHSSLQ